LSSVGIPFFAGKEGELMTRNKKLPSGSKALYQRPTMHAV